MTDRRKPSPGAKRIVITDRDLQMIRAVYLNRFLTKSLLLTLFPPDPTKTPSHLRHASPAATGATGTNLDRRLAKLFHNLYLTRVRTAPPPAEFVYGLGSEGAKLLKKHDPDLFLPKNWIKKNRELEDDYVDHALMIARFRVTLETAIPHAPEITLGDFYREVHLPIPKSHPDHPYIPHPDAFFRLHNPHAQTAFFLEADCSTMPHRKMLSKFQRYAAMYQRRLHTKHFDGIKGFRVLTVTPSHERSANLLDLVARKISPAHTDLFFFAPESIYAEHPTNVLAAKWRPAHTPDQFASILPSPLRAK